MKANSYPNGNVQRKISSVRKRTLSKFSVQFLQVILFINYLFRILYKITTFLILESNKLAFTPHRAIVSNPQDQERQGNGQRIYHQSFAMDRLWIMKIPPFMVFTNLTLFDVISHNNFRIFFISGFLLSTCCLQTIPLMEWAGFFVFNFFPILLELGERMARPKKSRRFGLLFRTKIL